MLIHKLISEKQLVLRNGVLRMPYPWEVERLDRSFWNDKENRAFQDGDDYANMESPKAKEIREELGVTEIVIPARIVSEEEFNKACARIDEEEMLRMQRYGLDKK